MKNSKIKKRLNVYLYYWTIPVFFLFILINYFSRNIKIEALDISLMISVVSFLFGFLISIIFGMILSRVSQLKETLAVETGRLVSLYLISKKIGEDFHQKIVKRIDNYTIKTLRYYTQYNLGRDEVYGIYKDLDNIEIKNKNSEALENSFLYILGEWESIREKLEYLTARRTEWSLKFANYLLGIILIVLLFLNRGDSFTNTLFVILSTIIVFIFLIIEDYDNLKIGDYTYNINNSEQIFDLIGKERYYPQEVLNRVRLEKGRTYRIGVIDAETKKERIISMVFNPTSVFNVGHFIEGPMIGN